MFTVDIKFIQPLTVTIFSLFKSNPELNFKIYLITEIEDESKFDSLKELINNQGSQLILKRIKKGAFAEQEVKYHFSPANYYRLLAFEMVPEDEVLYLDSDIIVHGPIQELLDTELENYPLAAVADPQIQDFDRLELSADQGYFNSGVMLLNLKLWRVMNLGSRVVDYCTNNPERIQYADQCGLNAILKGNWFRLNPKWNVMTSLFNPKHKVSATKYFGTEFNMAVQKPVIIHFSDAPKPWELRNQHPLKKLYWNYLNQTEFKRRFPEDLTFSNLFRWAIPNKLKKKYWKLSQKFGLQFA